MHTKHAHTEIRIFFLAQIHICIDSASPPHPRCDTRSILNRVQIVRVQRFLLRLVSSTMFKNLACLTIYS